MVLGKIRFCALILVFFLTSPCNADEVLSLRLFFGLSLPEGGAVSLADWVSFQENYIAKYFDGFNVVDAVGFYKGKPERSKVVTIILESKDVPKAKALASEYAKIFKQESVMVVTVPVQAWDFIGPKDFKETD